MTAADYQALGPHTRGAAGGGNAALDGELEHGVHHRRAGPAGGPGSGFIDDIVAYLDGYRMAGIDLQVEDGIQVPLYIQMSVCVQPYYLAADVEQALLAIFNAGTQPNGSPGLFNPGLLDLGAPFYLSPLVAAAQAVDGVASVQVGAFERMDQPGDQGLLAGVLLPQRLEFFVLDNDPNYPERGSSSSPLRGDLGQCSSGSPSISLMNCASRSG